jgi:iron-sulfur cluster assembly accessory protein
MMFKKCIVNYAKYLPKYYVCRHINSITKAQKQRVAKSIITVSPNATSRIITMFSLLNPPYPLGIRISINKRGCNGMNYIMNYINADDEGRNTVSKDDIITITDDVKIFIDPRAVFAIVGTVMDWKENEIVSEFTFTNPNAKGTCGCGESFNV